ncbi:helix-turn-helix domain-containing protein [Blastococcus brunescens]|uniref:Helix-turn-helix domain-containing protein n=1 Tax=Blastococcus brunescens TaxID=1564165 RepID=A0ABZ1AUT8_9ACTN|nr:helix-turn-helix domain-containing protein [Blastococcus sp. BMG 8361]WRL62338.1 helix-turn-helix domain-containing protein [Blastococcus sp. BMG 8361]
MSVRTFTRRFREETGLSASRWLVQQRVALARRLLESTDIPVERVAQQSGFGTTASMRQHLHAAIGVAPLAYRRTYRGRPLTRCDRRLPRVGPRGAHLWLSTTYRRRPRSSGAAGNDVGLRLRHLGAPG